MAFDDTHVLRAMVTVSNDLSHKDPIDCLPQKHGVGVVEKDGQANRSHTELTKCGAFGVFSQPLRLHSHPIELRRPQQKYNGHQHDCFQKSRSCIENLGAGTWDPFRTLPELGRGDTAMLAYHWNKNFILTTTPPGPRKQWFPFALTDPALFHATLLIAASHIAGSKRSRPSFAYFQHRGEVIQIVRDRISNGYEAASDGTVGAISMLLVTDSMSGHPERVCAHMAGLQQLICKRGGISALNPLVQRAVGWVDLLASISLLKRPLFLHPRFSKPDFYSYYRPPSSSTTGYALAFSARIMNFSRHQKQSKLAARILWGLRNISFLKEIVNQIRSDSREIIPFSDRVELLEREVQNLLHNALENIEQQAPASGKLHPELIFVIFAYATLIHICFNFRDMVPSAITRVLAERLELSMDIADSNLKILLGTFPDLMLWVLFIGGDARIGRPRLWYAKTASRILRVKKVEEETDIKAATTAFIWPEGRENYDDSVGEDIVTINASLLEANHV